MKKYLNHKSQLVNKFIRINGSPAKIAGMGNKALKLAFPMPNGFSHKKEVVQGFINWTDLTPELTEELNKLLPSKEGQQTLF